LRGEVSPFRNYNRKYGPQSGRLLNSENKNGTEMLIHQFLRGRQEFSEFRLKEAENPEKTL